MQELVEEGEAMGSGMKGDTIPLLICGGGEQSLGAPGHQGMAFMLRGAFSVSPLYVWL